jgi:hypothetical protein
MRIVTPTSVARAINCFPGRAIRLASSHHCGHFIKVLYYSSLRQVCRILHLRFLRLPNTCSHRSASRCKALLAAHAASQLTEYEPQAYLTDGEKKRHRMSIILHLSERGQHD